MTDQRAERGADDYDALLAVNRRLHAEIADVQSGRRCPFCWALYVNGHYPDCKERI